MHDRAIGWITSQIIFYDFAKGFRVQPFIEFADGLVHIFFAGGNSALGITIWIQ
jgi:hypothetical protein